MFKNYNFNNLYNALKNCVKSNKRKFCIVFSILFIILVCSEVYAADPTLVTKINSAFKKILSYLEKMSTPIAGVTIATGVIMRKLSFGDEEKMVKGKKVIVNAIIGYAMIMSIDLIIKFIEALI